MRKKEKETPMTTMNLAAEDITYIEDHISIHIAELNRGNEN